MKKAFTLACLGAASLTLGACGDSEKPEQQNTAGGEILERSVSDDMLPYDTVRSLPPLAPQKMASSEGAARSGDESVDEANEGETGEPETDAEGAPAQSPGETTPVSE
jgi:hypothetical protein